ncbi:hypothetical protein [Legionella tunisiensis]|uniref:hypothetical protein n=1 Tax=Legionella tunisiensis TaxID=1034944 RepID=UPI001E45023E|nr:hypothetical protein [Legionella tunisiensis]
MMLSLESATYPDLVIDGLKKALGELRDQQNLLQFYMHLSELMQCFHKEHHIINILSSENYDDISSEHLTTGTYLVETMASFKRMLSNYCLLTGKKNSFKSELTNTEFDNYFTDF